MNLTKTLKSLVFDWNRDELFRLTALVIAFIDFCLGMKELAFLIIISAILFTMPNPDGDVDDGH